MVASNILITLVKIVAFGLVSGSGLNWEKKTKPKKNQSKTNKKASVELVLVRVSKTGVLSLFTTDKCLSS